MIVMQDSGPTMRLTNRVRNSVPRGPKTLILAKKQFSAYMFAAILTKQQEVWHNLRKYIQKRIQKSTSRKRCAPPLVYSFVVYCYTFLLLLKLLNWLSQHRPLGRMKLNTVTDAGSGSDIATNIHLAITDCTAACENSQQGLRKEVYPGSASLISCYSGSLPSSLILRQHIETEPSTQTQLHWLKKLSGLFESSFFPL